MNIDPTSIIVALITLAGVIASAAITKNNLYHELDKKNAIFQEKLETIDEHFREVNHRLEVHNGYAKLFSENVPVINEQIKVINHRLDDLEHERTNNDNNK